MSMNDLSGLYKAQGRYKEAESLLIDTLQISIRILSKE